MKRLSFIAIVMTCVMGCAAAPQQGLEKLMDARGMRASSYDRNWENGNGDARPIPPGETIILADVEGPGIIRHIWFTIAATDPVYPRTTVLRMYWDGEEDPSVEAPLGDFFAVGHGMKDVTLHSEPVNISSDGRAYNCYWRMPFRKSAKITMTNDSDMPVHALYSYIDYTREKSIPKDSAYFHARYRQEYPCKSGEDYLFLEAVGRGHYVGTVQSVAMVEPGWYGEGDDRFYIDGEEVPSIQGTGTEDYFCDAWGFRVVNGLYYGVSIWEGYDKGDRGTAYRWHIPDPVPFEKSLKVAIEHKGARHNEKGHPYTGFEERPDCFSSVAYWYQTEPHKPFGEIPPVKQRTLPFVTYEAEDMMDNAVFTPDTSQVQHLPHCSGGKQMFFTPRVQDASFEASFDVQETQDGIVEMLLIYSWDYGIYDVYFDDELLFDDLNMYSSETISEQIRLGMDELSAGEHTVRFECVGSDPRTISESRGPGALGYFCGFDGVRVRKVTP